MKYQHVADVMVEFYSCATCVGGGGGGLNGTTIHQYLRNVCIKIALLNSLNFATSNEPNSCSFRGTALILVTKKAEFCDLQSYGKFFFPNFEKITASEFSVY